MTLEEYKAMQMKDPEFAAAYHEFEPELQVIRAMIDARVKNNMTQKELAERSGIDQSEISRLERGTRNPSIRLLQRIADAMNMDLKISFVPRG